MPGEIEPTQSQVADHIQDFVPGWFVSKADAVANWAAPTEHKQIGRAEVPADAHLTECVGFQLS